MAAATARKSEAGKHVIRHMSQRHPRIKSESLRLSTADMPNLGCMTK